MKKIVPCLWFDTEGEAAAQLYTSVFPNSKILDVARYGEAGPRPAGTVMTVSFELNGQEFLALNGGPDFKFNEAVSFQVICKDQKEVDYYWERLKEGGDSNAQQCGWLKDKFGLSWQVVPTVLIDMLSGKTSGKSERAMNAMMQMKKLDIAELERAYRGEPSHA